MKKIVSLVTLCVMLITLSSVSAFAQEQEDDHNVFMGVILDANGNVCCG